MAKLLQNLQIGHCHNTQTKTGVTVFLFNKPATTIGLIQGSAPATANFSSLDPIHGINLAHAVVFTGGSLLGLNCTSGVIQYLQEKKIGLNINDNIIPLVPAAAIFDLTYGENNYPNHDMAYQACLNATDDNLLSGQIGAGCGASVGKFLGIEHCQPGGFGWAKSQIANSNVEIWSFAVVNAMGDVIDSTSNKIIKGCQINGNHSDIRKKIEHNEHLIKFGTQDIIDDSKLSAIANQRVQNTTLILTITNAHLNSQQATLLAQAGHYGLASCIYPSHTIYDGDLVIMSSIGNLNADITALGYYARKTAKEAIIKAVSV